MLLGIVVIGLLGFFLYHYRPLNIETKFKQSLRWSEFAKGFFVCHPIFVLIAQYCFIAFMVLFGKLDLQFWMQGNNILLYPFDRMNSYSIVANLFMFAFPVASAWLTQKKLVEPLRKEKVPRKNLFHMIALFSIATIAYFISVWFISTLRLLPIFGYEHMLTYILSGLPWFTIIMLGIGAVELSRFKLNRSLQKRDLSSGFPVLPI